MMATNAVVLEPSGCAGTPASPCPQASAPPHAIEMLATDMNKASVAVLGGHCRTALLLEGGPRPQS